MKIWILEWIWECKGGIENEIGLCLLFVKSKTFAFFISLI